MSVGVPDRALKHGLAEAVATTDAHENVDKGMSARTADEIQVPSSKASLEQMNEKEIIEHPDEVTHSAQNGVQKAEATALVWPKTAVYAIYAW
jgi:hypothetical protein